MQNKKEVTTMNAYQCKKALYECLRDYHKEHDKTALNVRSFLIQLVYTTNLYELDAIKLMTEFLENGSLTLNNYNI